MRSIKVYIFIINLILTTPALIWSGNGKAYASGGYYRTRQDTIPADSIAADTLDVPYTPTPKPTFEEYDRFGDPFSNYTSPSPLLLQDPASLELDVEIDTGMNYTIYEKIGDINYRPTSTMTFEEFNEYQNQKLIKDYWKEKSSGLDGESAVSGRQLIPKLYISPVLDRIFGGSYVDIQPNGFVNLDFGGRWQKVENPSIPVRQQRNGGFNYNQQISMNVVGKVGEKLAITANFDNNNSFDFQNNLKVEFTGYEEDIIKKIEIGNVSMPIKNSLITGGQSLFGVKTQLQFGKLFVTGVASRQQGRSEVINVESGFQGREFEVRASNYDENRHFFLGHFFRQNYEQWLAGLPQIISGLNITRVEVYSLNRNNDTQTLRNFIGLMDLGEGSVIARPDNPNIGTGIGGANDNGANSLFQTLSDDPRVRDIDGVSDLLESEYDLRKSTDFERVTSARRLDEREFTVNRELGYVSLLRKLQNDEVLAVSYEYTYNGRTYKVGELTEDYQNRAESDAIILKLLRPTRINTRVPTWDLMMKNIYNLNASQVDRQGFTLRIHYRDDLTGIDNPSLHEGALTKDQPLIRLLGLDQLNPNNDPAPDGNFDYIEGITIDPRNGNIIFPVLEPFGRTLQTYFNPQTEQNLISKYVYDTLYRTTKNDAEQIASKDKFFILGRFMSGSASEIVLPGINIAENSVVVTAGNTPLTEGLDYTVDYNLGRVRIINQGVLNSGKQIQITYEKADLFNFQTRWLTGAHFDYRVSDDIGIGATILHLNERAGGVSRFKVGDEPTRNTKYGFDVNFDKESRLLTKMVDALPFVSTKEESRISFSGEFAQIIPGTSNLIDGEGTSYIDDFETAITPINLGNSPLSWMLGSTPETPDNRFDLSSQSADNLGYAYKRAKLAWYVIDPVFYLSGGPNKPANITSEDTRNHYVRAISPQEIFRQQDRQLVNTNLAVFDMAYFPSERGQYNYNPDLTPNGLLKDPETNYGAITKAITNEVDFDKTNVEYLEFWLMDPFIEGENGRVLDGIFNQNNVTGGDLVFQLGNVSEDLQKDGRHAFENGLPPDYDPERTIQNEWGRVTDQQYLNDFFDNNANTRVNQDVGLDGLKSEDEPDYFRESFLDRLSVNSQALQRIQRDVSADNYNYYLGDELDANDVKIVERYKNFNGMESNTPINTGNNFTIQGSPTPENEDLNRDNTLSDLEEYYEYTVKLRPGELEVGKNHIVDQVQDQSGEATWYLFRIPIRSPDRIQGDISGFKSMRFVRTMMTGWQQPAVMRMVKFQLVGSQWRKYLEGLNEKGFNEVPESYTSDFNVSVVNIEENSIAAEGKIPYVVPPGINRDFDNTTVIQRRNNEQSLQICVEDLEDRDARAVYKNVGLDLINYGQIKMFFHAEAHAGDRVEDDETTAFIRFGTDFTENYYEIEVPLKITPQNISGSGDDLARQIWPLENEIDLSINELYALKSRRNRENFSVELPYKTKSENGQYNLSLVGRPDMTTVMTMMIGVRNPGSDDRAPKSICVWANELRVTDFNREKGWAANARLSAKLADLGTVSASTRYTSFGFGSIQQRIAERTREETTQYDVSANMQLDKLLPGEHGLKIPMFVSLEKQRITPRFDPLDPDIPLEASLLAFDTDEQSSDYRRIVEDRSERRALNFTNVRKERTNPESRKDIWDIENLAFSYSFSDLRSSSVNTQSYVLKQYKGGVAYNFAPQEKSIEPFKNVGALDGKYLQIIKEFNINPIPSNLSVRGDLDRRFIKTQLRNADLTTDGIDPFFEKFFTFNRNYNLRWNLFKSLSLDYSARANAIIDEPEGDIDSQVKRDSIWNNVKRLGRMKNYNQTISANYRLPLDKIPITDWVNADLRYSAGYNWLAGAVGQSDTLGNVASNNRTRDINGKLDLVKLYNKVPILKEINTPSRRKSTRGAGPQQKTDTLELKKSQGKAGKGLLRLLMSVRSVNFTYSIRESTVLPGFLPSPYLFGADKGFDAPGWGFITGSQDPNIRFKAAEEGWLAKSSFLTMPFTQTRMEDLNLRGTVEPLKDLKIQLDAKKTSSGNFQEIFRFDGDSINDFVSLTPSRTGSYSISFMALKTTFINDTDQEEYIHPTFNDFVANREIIRQRLNSLNGNGEYQLNSQDVLIPSFIAAYSGKDASEVNLSPFPKTPLPNWRVDYAGLSNIPALQEVFSSVNITHSYQSTFSVGNYANSLLYDQDLELTNDIVDYPLASVSTDNGIVPVYIVNQVAITERFSPLIGVNVRTKNRLTAKVDYKRERNLSLNLSNAQVTELRSSDISFDIGFTKDKFKLPFKVQGRTVVLENDIQFRMSFTIRDTKTIQRKIEETNAITNGNLNFQLRPTVSYVLNQKLNLTMYFERNINEPRLTNSYRRTSSAFGVQLRFSLSQ